MTKFWRALQVQSMLRDTMRRSLLLAVLLVLTWRETAVAQTAAPNAPTSVDVAFVNVNVLSFDTGTFLPRQTVLVRADRIAAVGSRDAIAVPDTAAVIDGLDRYLVPGLTDSHVHLTTDMPWAPTRSGFGDAPLYLAHGVTTVFNLRGGPEQLDWRRLVNAGELLGPTIYTSGEFVNEPRLHSPAEIARDIAAQRDAGYDLIKFHEIWTPGVGLVTTRGLSRPAYLAMSQAARDAGLPLVGHAPVNLGLDALLEARQPLAHLGTLSNIYFLPLASHRGWLIATIAAFAILMAIGAAGNAIAVSRWWRDTGSAAHGASRVRWLVNSGLLASALAGIAAALFLPGGTMFASTALRVLFTVLIVLLAVATTLLVMTSAALWRADAPAATLAHSGIATLASLALSVAGIAFWTPVIWRSSDAGIEYLARRLRDADIPVQTTLVAYDAIGGPRRSALAADPAAAYLLSETQAVWRGIPAAGPPWFEYTAFMQKVAAQLHRAGVKLVVGTDAMGVGLVAPGSSLHRELALLTAAGITPYEAIRAATLAPARFIGQEAEFGAIVPGQRADLLLIDLNPLEDLSRLHRPAGVMTRGRWLTRDRLDQLLATIDQQP